MFKKIFIFFCFIFIISEFVFALNDINEIYNEQLHLSGMDKLTELLPKDSVKTLENMGIKNNDFSELSKLSPIKIFNETIKKTKEKFSSPMKSVSPVIAVILLCAMIDSIDFSLKKTKMSEIMSAIGSICICTCIIGPIVEFIATTSGIIKAASEFIICFIPIMVGIMLASGQTVSASSYHIMMTGAGQIISYLCTGFLVPLMNTMLGIATMSSITPRLKLNGLCGVIYRVIKSFLGISVSAFVSLLALQTLVASPTDNIGGKTAKLALSSFVPIVGSALGDACSTIQSCLKLLKSGAGVFGIIALGILFLPALVECMIWIFLLSTCSAASDILSQGKISGLLRSISKVLQALMAIILSCVAVFIVSTVIILIIGSGG